MTTHPQTRTQAREFILVDAQILLQAALNKAFGNPRDEENPEREKRLFKEQRRHLSSRTGWSKKKVKRLFADNSNMSLKDLSEALHVLEHALQIKSVKLIATKKDY